MVWAMEVNARPTISWLAGNASATLAASVLSGTCVLAASAAAAMTAVAAGRPASPRPCPRAGAPPGREGRRGGRRAERGGRPVAGCAFGPLGWGWALSLGGGAHGCRVDGGHFYDLSGSAVQIGRNDRFAPDTPLAERELDNGVSDSLVEWAANAFHGAVGLQIGTAHV